MRKTRSLIYLNAEVDQNLIIADGIQFKEFVDSLQHSLNNLLILQGGYYGHDFDFTTRCEYVRNEHLHEILQEDVYNYGDFCWVDFENVDSLAALTPQEVAELLYLGKLMKPLSSPFFKKLNNRFAYLAHDDGWYNLFYCGDMDDFFITLGKIIQQKIKQLYEKSVPLIADEVLKKIAKLSRKGLLIDLNTFLAKKSIKCYIIGKTHDIDGILNNEEDYKNRASEKFELKLNGEWGFN